MGENFSRLASGRLATMCLILPLAHYLLNQRGVPIFLNYLNVKVNKVVSFLCSLLP